VLIINRDPRIEQLLYRSLRGQLATPSLLPLSIKDDRLRIPLLVRSLRLLDGNLLYVSLDSTSRLEDHVRLGVTTALLLVVTDTWLGAVALGDLGESARVVRTGAVGTLGQSGVTHVVGLTPDLAHHRGERRAGHVVGDDHVGVVGVTTDIGRVCRGGW